MKKLLLSFFVLVVFIFTTNSLYSAEITSAQSGPWASASTWVGGVPTSSDNVTIVSGHTVEVVTSGVVCNNLTIQSTGKVWGNAAATTSKFIRIYGTTLTVDGTYGGTNDALGFSLYGASGQTLTISGTGTFKANRVQQNAGGDFIVFNMDAEVHYAGGSGTGGAGLYPSAGDLTVTVNAGKTLTMANHSYLTANTSSGDAAGSNNFTLHVYGTITCSGANSKFNLNVIAGKTGSLTIYNGGTVNIYSYLRGNATNLGTVNVNVNNGGQLNGFSGSFFDLSTATTTVNGMVDFGLSSTATRSIGTATVGATGWFALWDSFYPTGSITLHPDSWIGYFGADPISLGSSPSTYPNLYIKNSGVTLTSMITVSGLCGIAGSGVIIESPGKYILGITRTQKTVGTNASTFGGIGVSINSGTDDLGQVWVTRATGPSASIMGGINRNWMIESENPPTNGRIINFYWDPADDNGKDLSQAQVWKSTNSGSNWFTVGGVQNAVGTNTVNVATTSFSSWTVSDVNTPLPVELASFTANVGKNGVMLKWLTKTETNNYGWDVEVRNTSEATWQKVGFVNGAGNSNSPKEYSFAHKQNQSGKYLYRLKQIDGDGRISYSNEISVDVQAPQNFALAQNYPNPFNPSTTINYSLPIDSRVSLELYSLVGEKVADLVNEAQASGFYSYNFNTSNLNLTSGVYLYKLTAVSNSNEVFSQSMKMLLLK